MNDKTINQKEYDFVIIGGGPAAFGVVNALQEKSQTPLSIVVLEQGNRFEGSADASMKHFRTYQLHKTVAENVQQTIDWYKNLAKQFPDEESTIYSFPYLYIAQTEERLEMYRQNLTKVQEFGFGKDAKILPAREITDKYPFIDLNSNFLGGLLYPEAGWINLTRGFQHIMDQNQNVTFLLNTQAKKITSENGKIVSVLTNKGEIKTSKVILAQGAFVLQIQELLESGVCELPLPIAELIRAQKSQSYEAAITGLAADTRLFLVHQSGAYVRINGEKSMYGYSYVNGPVTQTPEVSPVSEYETFSDQVFEQLGTIVSSYGTKENHGKFWNNPTNFKAGYIVETPDKLPIVSDTNIPGLYICAALGHIGVMIHIGLGRIMADIILNKKDATNPFPLFRNY